MVAIEHDLASFLNSLLLVSLARPVPGPSLRRLRRAFLDGYGGADRYAESALTFLQAFGLPCVVLEILGRRRSRVARWWLERFLSRSLAALSTGRNV